jgi:hypothetical protein
VPYERQLRAASGTRHGGQNRFVTDTAAARKLEDPIGGEAGCKRFNASTIAIVGIASREVSHGLAAVSSYV